jgi:pimeloyl-ACP methyl ester carboxylesterase
MMASLRHFFPNVPNFAPDYRILCVSLRGHGDSGRPQPESLETYSITKMANDLRLLVDHLGIEQFHYIGHSMGGMVGYEFYRQYPDYFKSMINLGTPVRLNLNRGFVSLAGWFQLQMVRFLGVERMTRFFAKQATKEPASLDFLVAEVMNPVNWPATMLQQRRVAKISFLDVLAQVQVPLLAIYGESDPGLPLQMKLIKAAAENNPHISTEIIQGGGHVANLDQPQIFNQLLTDFITQERQRQDHAA